MPIGRMTTRGTAGPFKLKPWNTIFKDKDHGWSPLFWVLYLGFFFVDPVMSHASVRVWLLDAVGAALFLVLYFGLFFLECPRALLHIGGMVLLGVLYQPINGGASTFFIFAAAMLPFCVETQTAAVLGLQQTAASNRYIRAVRRLKEILSTVPGSGGAESRP